MKDNTEPQDASRRSEDQVTQEDSDHTRLHYIAEILSRHAQKFPVPGHMEAHADFLRSIARRLARTEPQDASRPSEGLAAKYADLPIDEKARAMADDCVGDPWELLGYFREKLEQAESDRETWKERVYSALRTHTGAGDALLREAREALCNHACHTGDGVCFRPPHECASQCGKAAGYAIASIDAYLKEPNQ